ncbi:type II CRISPR RNA-guided endonuclease Cas9 [Tenacibaculum piscium]|uniref:type II CRISPR RNA-guided endonuclease Cas9 n=1 Tax=Tenacibaculum piscium TaxID=1458515 RepID=UPI001F30C402|nr:type II CRISPR RNA-guided endonuclease Cas9 [Tenacibaculum piscium]
MSKILGLDLGTNSLGWAIVDNNNEDNKETFELKDKGVVIFSEGVKLEKGNEISKAAERTAFRGTRRLKFRRKLRKYETLLILSKNGMCPLSVEEVIAWKKSGFKKYPLNEDFLNWLKTDDDKKKHPYFFRDKASKEKLNKLDLGRAFYHLAQRRGFLSNRLDQSDKGAIEKHQPRISEILEENKTKTGLIIAIDEFFKEESIIDFKLKEIKDLDAGGKELLKLYKAFKRIIKENDDLKSLKINIHERLNKKGNSGAVKQGIENLDDNIKNGKFETLGQYFYSIYGKSNQRIRNQYTAREEHYLDEFEQICTIQNLGEIIEKENEPNKKYKGLTLDLYKAIFYQRPLKSQKGLVGKCTLEPTKYRCPISRPEFEEFRMYQYLNNFKIKFPENEKLRALTVDEKQKVEYLFYRKTKTSFDFEEIVKKLIPKNEKAVYYKNKDAKTANYVVNFSLNTSLSNCPSIAHFRAVFGEDWKNLKYTYKTIDTKGVAKTRSVNYQDIWHVWTTFTSNPKLYDFAITKLGLTEKKAIEFSKVTLKKDYSSLSLKAINNILPYLEAGLIYSHAVFMANMKNVVNEKHWNNQEDKKLIQSAVKKIIDTHQIENKLQFVINGYIKKNIKSSYSKEADYIYRKELEQSFEDEFGKKKWQTLNTNDIFEDNYLLFVEKFSTSENRFLKIKRIDEKVLDFLKGENETGEVFLSDEKKLYHPSDIEKFKLEEAKNKEGITFTVLGSPLSNSIKNPMAMKSLHKIRELINTLILEEKIDENTKIHIELARELNDANKRMAIQKWQYDKAEERKIYRKKIQELYKPDFEPTLNDLERFKMVLEQREDKKIVSKDDVSKYKLWTEQRHICLYTGNTISLTGFLSENPAYDIEHTIPRSVSIDDSQMNKTLCEKKFNRDIKKNKIPFKLVNHAEIMGRISHWKDKYEKLDSEIKGLLKASKTATDKEAKDRIIQKRHYLKMEYNYWKSKYNRFELEEVKAGFKNSQITDIGIITKYAQQYLKSYFKSVYSVKGTMVDQFKKAWGVKKTIIDEDGIEKKDRSNHIHHCVDAITIACMTKNKYDILANAWGLDEKAQFNKAKKELENSKPWKTFSKDVNNIQNEVLIVHSHKDKVPIQSKKKLRIRGKIQYRVTYKKDAQGTFVKDNSNQKIVENYHYLKDIQENKIPVLGKKDKDNPDFILHTFLDENSKEIKQEVLKPDFQIIKTDKTKAIEYRKYVISKKNNEIIYQRQPLFIQGDTVRGSLHKDTFYGAILEQDFENNKTFAEDKEGNGIVKYVVRKPLDGIKKSDVAKIVDEVVKGIIQQAITDKILVAKKDVYKIETDKTVWMNEKKQIPIRKVRVYTPSIKNPLNDFKKHALKDVSKHPHKREYYVQNDENYCMAIYEGKNKKGELKREFEIVNLMDAGNYYKLSNATFNKENPITPINKNKLPLKTNLLKGQMVLFYKDNPLELWELSKLEILTRLYKIKTINKDGRVKYVYHQEARNEERVKEDYFTAKNIKPPKSLTNGFSEFNFINIDEKYLPFLLLSKEKHRYLIENVDFKITTIGKIVKL